MEVYIVAPANIATGGPELLHQFAKKLIDNGVNVKMYYLPIGVDNPVHENYKEYDISYTHSITDIDKNIIIVPEVYTEILTEFKYIRKFIWWLSIDNYFFTLSTLKAKINRRLLTSLNSQKYLFFNPELKDDNIMHMYQSEYAKLFLLQHGITCIFKLSDYIHQSFIEKANQLYDTEKKNIVVYNPLKGTEFTKKLITISKDINFIPIQNMTRDEVIELLSSSKVYMDFGFHPGKDRIPREAVLLGNCIITNRKGSASNTIDVPIDNSFKFVDKNFQLNNIYQKIKDMLNNYGQYKVEFQAYRNEVLQQEEIFDREVNMFIKRFIK